MRLVLGSKTYTLSPVVIIIASLLLVLLLAGKLTQSAPERNWYTQDGAQVDENGDVIMVDAFDTDDSSDGLDLNLSPPEVAKHQ